MSWREKIAELVRKGNFENQNVEQYIRFVYLKGDDKYSPKASIEIGKVIDGEIFAKPASFRTDRKEDLVIMVKSLIKLMKKMGYTEKDVIEIIINVNK